jgi:hypothetical protein
MKQPESCKLRSYLPHTRVKELRLKLREGNPQAAIALLLHSLRVGHRRLSVHRYLTAYALGVENLDNYLPLLRVLTKKMQNSDIRQIITAVTVKLNLPEKFFEAIEQSVLNKEGRGKIHPKEHLPPPGNNSRESEIKKRTHHV